MYDFSLRHYRVRTIAERGGAGLSVASALLAAAVFASGAWGQSPEAAGSNTATPKSSIRFEWIPASSLPRFTHFNGQTRRSLLPEDNGSGCAWGDFDGDGDDDLFLCNLNGNYLTEPAERSRMPGSRLWRNDGRSRFTDVTEEVGLDDSEMDMGAVFVDYDNDGDADLLVTSLAGIRLYQNDGGRFRNVTEKVGLGGVRDYCLGAAWGDYDRDGRLDLYVCRYVDFPIDKARNRPLVSGRPATMTTPGNYPALANYLFRQLADGTFEDVTERSGTQNADGRSMQALWCDFDNDGLLDLFVANDQSFDCLFRNNGKGGFTDMAMKWGIFDPRGAMGLAVMDLHADGDQDLLVTHWVSEDPAFYVNDRAGDVVFFDDRAVQVGLRKKDLALVGWGTGFEDFDNDGDFDLFIVHGSTIEDELTLDVLKNPKMLPQASQIYENRDGFWHPLGAAAGEYFGRQLVGRGAALSDFDLDGRPDIAINNHGGSPALLRNVTAQSGHWLGVRLEGRHCNRDGVNARVTVHVEGQPPMMRELFAGSSYLSGHTRTLHFGLGSSDRVGKSEVLWPCGRLQTVKPEGADRILQIAEETDGES